MDPHNENPYTPPAYDTLPSGKPNVGGLHREGNVLVATKNATFPDRCVKCNDPAEGYRLKRTLYWHHPGYYVIILICNVIIYAVVAMIVRKTATYQVGVCPYHRDKRRNAMIIGWGGALSSVGFFVAAGVFEEPLYIIPGIVVFLGAIIWGIIGSRVIFPKRIDNTYAWINGVGPEFLQELAGEKAPF